MSRIRLDMDEESIIKIHCDTTISDTVYSMCRAIFSLSEDDIDLRNLYTGTLSKIIFMTQKEFMDLQGLVQKDDESENSEGRISMKTRDYHIPGRNGTWTAIDQIIFSGQSFFLMENQEFHKDAAYKIIDAYGKEIIEKNHQGFDPETKKRLQEYAIRQNDMKYGDNGSAFQPIQETLDIDGTNNRANMYQQMFSQMTGSTGSEKQQDRKSPNEDRAQVTKEQIARSMQKGAGAKVKSERDRRSVLLRLYQKQNEIAMQSGRTAPYEALQE